MSQQMDRPCTHATRSPDELRRDRVAGVAAWQQASRLREQDEAARNESREAGVEARRRLDALRRTNGALQARSETIESQPPVTQVVRAVIVHRHEWLRAQLAKGLTEQGFCVVAVEQDGADGLGVAIAEQPDLLVIEARLPSVKADELVSSMRHFAPHTVVAAQVEHDGDADVMLAAGAAAVFNRRVPPFRVCEQLVALLQLRPVEPLILT